MTIRTATPEIDLKPMPGMPLAERIKSLIVHTPAERPVIAIRRGCLRIKHRRRPELAALYCDDDIATEAVLRARLAPTSNCIDAGAHLGGVLSLLIRLAPRGRHIAVEPLPAKAERLARKFAGVRVHCCALGNQSGEVSFYLTEGITAASGLKRSSWHGSRQLEVRVELARLDDLIAVDHVVDLLKLVVEGGELDLLEGAERILDVHAPLILFKSTHLEQAPGLFDRLVRRHGYAIFTPRDLDRGGAPLSKVAFIDGHRAWPYRALNYFAVPPSAR